jgi:3-keto-5-aminohexanoate cleavage enzyme
MDHPVWLEVALNGPWSRELQPAIPVTVDEIVRDGIACARAGAAIVHLHAYDEANGRQRDDADLYARIIEGIRTEVDAIVYPTLPLAGGPDAPQPMAAEQRFLAVEELARRGLLEWSVIDPGTVNFTHAGALARGQPGFVYLNPEDHIRHGLELARQHGFHPGYAIYEPGFLRAGALLHRAAPGCPIPVYRFMFSSGFSWGFPPEEYALDAYRHLLQDIAPGAPWMVAGLDVDIRPLIGRAVAHGGHVRVGLEDAPFGERRSNLQQVEDARTLVEKTGATLATPRDVRSALAQLTDSA